MAPTQGTHRFPSEPHLQMIGMATMATNHAAINRPFGCSVADDAVKRQPPAARTY